MSKQMKKIEKAIEQKKVNEPISIKSETKSLLKIIFILLLCVGLIYLITAIVKGEITLGKHDTNEQVSSNVILAGTIFTQTQNEYYIFAYDFNGDDKERMEALYTNNSSTHTIYKVNLNDALNSSIISDTSNKDAQSGSELKINGTTAIKIKNQKNVLYIENVNNISSIFN